VQACGADPLYYVENGVSLLNVTCIACDEIPQMSSLHVLWQVSHLSL
jgi:hypothetical protein